MVSALLSFIHVQNINFLSNLMNKNSPIFPMNMYRAQWVQFLCCLSGQLINIEGDQYSTLQILSLFSQPTYNLLRLGSQRKSLTFSMASLSTGLMSLRMSQIQIALLVATTMVLAKDSTLMGISLEIHVSVFFPFLKSKIPHSYSPFDLFSKSSRKQYRLLESWRKVDFLKSRVSFSGSFRSKDETISLTEQMTCELEGLKMSFFMGWSVSLTILLLPSQRQLIECFLQLWWNFEKSMASPKQSMRPVNSALELDWLTTPFLSSILSSFVMKYWFLPYQLKHFTLSGGYLSFFFASRRCLISTSTMS